jgi:hypothetical protein
MRSDRAPPSQGAVCKMISIDPPLSVKLEQSSMGSMAQWGNDCRTYLESPTIDRTVEAVKVRTIEMPGQYHGYE